MLRLLPFIAAITALAWSISSALVAGNAANENAVALHSDANLSDLTLSNFFSEGWSQARVKRDDPDKAPDMALLRVQTNFLENEVRVDYTFQEGTGNSTNSNVHFLNALATYSFNRRFMFEVIGNEQWNNLRAGGTESGTGGAVLARFQLIDTPDSSYALNTRVSVPNHGLGEHLTTLAVSLAGWENLSRIGLGRTGLYWHIQEEAYAGPGSSSTRRNDLTYALSLAYTWTAREVPVFGHFTTFLEAFARTDLDGAHQGTTALSLTPGIRTRLGGGHILMAGVDIPISHPRTYEATYRLTYVYNF